MNHALVRGHTLPELLTGLTVGLLVVAIGWVTLGTCERAWHIIKTSADLHHQGMTVLDNLVRHARETQADRLHASEGPQADALTLGTRRARTPTDCQGNPGGQNDWRQLAYRVTPRQELQCKDLLLAGSSYQALADGVEDFRVRLAERAPGTAGLQWRRPGDVVAWTHVVAIELCLRLRSARRFHTPGAAIAGCQGESVQADGRMRLVLRRLVRLPVATTP